MLMRGMFLRKSIEQLQREGAESDGLKRSLSATNLMALGVGGIIGAGIFVITGQAAAHFAGPAILLSFVLGAIACAFAGLCYAEMASTVPVAGSAYTYAYATMGEFVAWIIGWDLILEYSLGATTVAIGWSGYVTSFLRNVGINLPPEWTAAPSTTLVNLPADLAAQLNLSPGWMSLKGVSSVLASKGVDVASLPHLTPYMNLPAVLIVALVTWILIKGVQESARVNNFFVVLKVAIVLLFIGAGFAFVNIENWGGSFIPDNTGNFGEFGLSGILRGAGVVFFAYIGFDAVSTTAQEAKNPQRDLPIGILGSLIICTILYILVAYVLTGVINYKLLGVPDPMALGVDAIGMTWLSPLIKLGAIAGLSSVILVLLLSQPRIFYAMANDGLLPKAAARLHHRYKTPHITTMITGLVVAVAAGLLPMDVVGELVSIGTLFAFAVVCVGVLVLRVTQPNVKRPFKAPFVWVTAPLGALSSIALMAGLPLDTWLRLFVWLAIGLAIYLFYGRKHSKLGRLHRTGAAAFPIDKI